MGNQTLYFVPEATINDRFVFDGIYAYEALSSLNGLNGKGKRFFKKIGKGLKKLGAATYKVVKKVVPIASTITAFIPVVGWGVSAALTAAEIAINMHENNKKSRSENTKSVSPRPVSNQPQKPVIHRNYQMNDYQSYKKSTKPTGIRNVIEKPQPKKNLSPEQIMAITKAKQPNPKDYSNYIDEKGKSNVTANTMRTETQAQMRVNKNNIFNTVLENLFT